jgi:alanyl-tRNA synthetase
VNPVRSLIVQVREECVVHFGEEEYNLRFFTENGFQRKKCRGCGAFYWSQDPDPTATCGEAPCQGYTFIGNPPTKHAFTVEEARETFLAFFEERAHTRINPYPIVARWRDDLFVTIASIIDFQPYVTDGVIPPPANPLVISQPCLRFNDIDNVGPTAGRHYTIFEMGGHHAFNYPDRQVYWKEKTVAYHYDFITQALGVPPASVSYKESVWSGGGNLGPCFECLVSGLEDATLVFMQYKIFNGTLHPMPVKVVDTGYGMERYAWLSQGTPSGFHAVYGSILEEIRQLAGMQEIDDRLLAESAKYSALMNVETHTDKTVLRSKVAERLGMDTGELDRLMTPIESVYTIADHSKASVLMLAEGVVPSNVKEGYLIRLLIRKTYRLMRSLGIEVELPHIFEMQINRWSPSFPHIQEMRTEILEALSVEEKRYRSTLERGIELSRRIVQKLDGAEQQEVPVKTLIELYDSHGIPPEIVRETVGENVSVQIPSNFYSMIAEHHGASRRSNREPAHLGRLREATSDLPETGALYYEDPYLKAFTAHVLRVVDAKYLVLDKTAFYPEGGGQKHDLGILVTGQGRLEIQNVVKLGNVIVHEFTGQSPQIGEEVQGEINWHRRVNLMRHHTATHIILGAVRRVLGEHAWQAGAEKEVDRSRLDVSHWKRITPQQERTIEQLANSIVASNIPVKVSWMAREEAEKTYGFRLYQGGIAPGRLIRVVRITDWDVEACGGTHLRMTGEIGLIKIAHTERIQDGVERIIFASGPAAITQVQEKYARLKAVSKVLRVPEEVVVKTAKETLMEIKTINQENERLKDKLATFYVGNLLDKSRTVKSVKLITHMLDGYDIDFLITIANMLTKKEARAVVLLGQLDQTVRIVVMAGERAVMNGVDAGKIASAISRIVGGGGSGRPNFGQGGGTQLEKVSDALRAVTGVVEEQIGGEQRS